MLSVVLVWWTNKARAIVDKINGKALDAVLLMETHNTDVSKNASFQWLTCLSPTLEQGRSGGTAILAKNYLGMEEVDSKPNIVVSSFT